MYIYILCGLIFIIPKRNYLTFTALYIYIYIGIYIFVGVYIYIYIP